MASSSPSSQQPQQQQHMLPAYSKGRLQHGAAVPPDGGYPAITPPPNRHLQPPPKAADGMTWGRSVQPDAVALHAAANDGSTDNAAARQVAQYASDTNVPSADAVELRHTDAPSGRMTFPNLNLIVEVPPQPGKRDQPPLPYRRFAVGGFTIAHSASPFVSLGDVPHDDTIVASGVTLFERPAGDPQAPAPSHEALRAVPSSFLTKGPATACGPNPAFIAKHPTADVVYVSNEVEASRVGAYTVCDSCFSSLGPAVSTEGAYACHVTVTPDGTWVAASSYGAGTVTFVRVDTFSKACGLTEEKRVLRLPRDAPGPDVDRQGDSGPHAHCCVFGKQLATNVWAMYVVDLGSDRIYAYRFDTSEATWEPARVDAPFVSCPPGSGPRGIVLVGESRAAVGLEITAEVMMLEVLDDGSLAPLSVPCVMKMLPPDWPESGRPEVARFNGGRWASDIASTPDGRWIFVCLRLRNTVICLRHDPSEPVQCLKIVSEVPTGGETPRMCLLEVVNDAIAVLYIAHHHGHNVTRVLVYLDSGAMEHGVTVAHAPLASCICPLN